MHKILWIDNDSGPVRNPDLSDAEFEAGAAKLQAKNLASLWQAAHDFEYAEISGTAIGLLVLGILQSKPKCLAVQAWDQSIWAIYYARKPLITEIWDAPLLDFSSCGPCPYTVPELLEEVMPA